MLQEDPKGLRAVLAQTDPGFKASCFAPGHTPAYFLCLGQVAPFLPGQPLSPHHHHLQAIPLPTRKLAQPKGEPGPQDILAPDF